MRRLARPLFTLCSAVSLLLFVAVCVLWAWSYRAAEGWSWSDGVRVPTAGYGIAWRNVLLVRGGRVFFIADRNMGGTAHQRRLDRDVAETAYRVHYAPPVGRAGASGWRLLGFEHSTYRGYPMIASTMSGPPVELTRGAVDAGDAPQRRSMAGVTRLGVGGSPGLPSGRRCRPLQAASSEGGVTGEERTSSDGGREHNGRGHERQTGD